MNTFLAPRFRLGWFLFFIGALSSLAAFVGRWGYENTLRNVQLTVDYEDTRAASDAYQIPHAQLLKELKNRGVSSVGIYNHTLGTLQGNGRLSVISRDEAQALYPRVPWAQYPPSYRYLIVAPPQSADLLKQVQTHLQEQDQPILPVREVVLPTQVLAGGAATNDASRGLLISSSQQLRGDAQLGFDPSALQAIKAAGMVPTARVSNALNLNLSRMRRLLDECKATGARVVIFSEDEVLGYDTLFPQVAKEMEARRLLFGNIEFTKQRGWADFGERTKGQLVRVHSVGADEAAKAKTHLLVDRYARAIKERNIRVAYIRMIRQFKGEVDVNKGTQMKSALQQNLDFVAEVSAEIKKAPVPFLRPALTLGVANGFGEYPFTGADGAVVGSKVGRYLTMLGAGLGAFGAFWLLLNLFFDLSVRAKSVLLFLGLVMVGVLSLSSGIGAKAFGLVSGVCVAPVAMLWGGLPKFWNRIDDTPLPTGYGGTTEIHVSAGEAFRKGFGVLLQTTLIALAGATFIVAAFNHWQYIGKTDEFLGEKATLMGPPLLMAIAFAGRVFPESVARDGSAQARRLALIRFQNVLAQPFTFRVAVTGMLIAIGGYFFIARAGNDSGMEISTLEWNFRSLMEQIFLTRPRTKEMFFGMPAMIFAVYFALKRQPLWALGAAIAASVGQADVVNTFCHFWTPLFYSLLRTVHAVWIGALLGGLALWLWIWSQRTLLGRLRPLSLGTGSAGGGGPRATSAPVQLPPSGAPLVPAPIVPAPKREEVGNGHASIGTNAIGTNAPFGRDGANRTFND